MELLGILKAISSAYSAVKGFFKFLSDLRYKLFSYFTRKGLEKLNKKHKENQDINIKIEVERKQVGNDDKLKDLHRKRNR